MYTRNASRFSALSIAVSLGLFACATSAVGDDPGTTLGEAESTSESLTEFTMPLWEQGVIPYRYGAVGETAKRKLDDGSIIQEALTTVSAAAKLKIRAAMDVWQAELSRAHGRSPVVFRECVGAACPAVHLMIRVNMTATFENEDGDTVPYESGMGCAIGARALSPSDIEGSRLRVSANPDSATLIHELGHCIGLVHQHESSDARRWLTVAAANKVEGIGGARTRGMPILGNYDYDSVMHYGAGTPASPNYTDAKGNYFSRFQLTKPSAHDVSRVIQYYARQASRSERDGVTADRWGFFEHLAAYPEAGRPNPRLAAGVDPAGVPAIAARSQTDFDIVARGAEKNGNGLYVRRYSKDDVATRYIRLATTDSDPSAATTAGAGSPTQIAYVRAGRVRLRSFDPPTDPMLGELDLGTPGGGVRVGPGGRPLAPAVVVHENGGSAIFAVQADGRLAVRAKTAMGRWMPWTTVGAQYTVSASPSAAAMNDGSVRLALNLDGTRLSTLRVVFEGPTVVSATFSHRQDVQLQTGTSPAIAARSDVEHPYRVVIVNGEGRISHAIGTGRFLDIGGIAEPGTGIAATKTGPYQAHLLMLGTSAKAADAAYTEGGARGARIQSGGLWLRRFE